MLSDFSTLLRHNTTKSLLTPGLTVDVGRGSSVSTATSYGLDGPGIRSRWGQDFLHPFQSGPGADPASYKMGTGAFSGVKWPGRGANHPPHLAPMLKKE